jgi:hypothetical protein
MNLPKLRESWQKRGRCNDKNCKNEECLTPARILALIDIAEAAVAFRDCVGKTDADETSNDLSRKLNALELLP